MAKSSKKNNKPNNKGKAKKNKGKKFSGDGFLRYQVFKANNQFGTEYGGLNGPGGRGPIFEKT